MGNVEEIKELIKNDIVKEKTVSTLASKYNIAGLTTGSKIPGHRFQNPVNYAACIDSLCKNLIKHYISQHHTTISSIQNTYAPGNKEWANSIKNTMGELSTTIMKPYRTTPKNHKDKKAVAKK